MCYVFNCLNDHLSHLALAAVARDEARARVRVWPAVFGLVLGLVDDDGGQGVRQALGTLGELLLYRV